MSIDTDSSDTLLVIVIAASAITDHHALREQLVSSGVLDQPGVSVAVALLEGQAMEAPERNLTLVQFAHQTPFFEQYAAIIEKTRSRYIALLDASCPPVKGWLDAAKHAMEHQTPVFFGPVNSGWPHNDSRIVGYLIEYAQFRAPIDPHLPEYPGNNIVFQRALLQKAPSVGAGFQKTFFLRQVRDKHGITPTPRNDMPVTYLKQYAWGYYLRRRYCHGRLYGASHAEVLGGRRFLYAAGILILPVLRYSRILRASKRLPTLSRKVLKFSISILVSELAWSAGECAGYIAGAPKDGLFLD